MFSFNGLFLMRFPINLRRQVKKYLDVLRNKKGFYEKENKAENRI